MPNITIERRNGDVHHIVVNQSDLESCLQHVWRVEQNRHYREHAYTYIEGRRVWMHRWLLGLSGQFPRVEHRDGNGLNNRRENLRIVG